MFKTAENKISWDCHLKWETKYQNSMIPILQEYSQYNHKENIFTLKICKNLILRKGEYQIFSETKYIV